jgi:hypothetical protein
MAENNFSDYNISKEELHQMIDETVSTVNGKISAHSINNAMHYLAESGGGSGSSSGGGASAYLLVPTTEEESTNPNSTNVKKNREVYKDLYNAYSNNLPWPLTQTVITTVQDGKQLSMCTVFPLIVYTEKPNEDTGELVKMFLFMGFAGSSEEIFVLLENGLFVEYAV